MAPNQFFLNALKYATFTLVGLIVAIAAFWFFGQSAHAPLSGRLLNAEERGEIRTVHFSREDVRNGFSAPADTHVIFDLPEDVRIPRLTFFGGTDIDQAVKYWGYCYSGNEANNKAAGKVGKAIYDGQFYYALRERTPDAVKQSEETDLLGILHGAADTKKEEEKKSIAEIFWGGKTCYAMIDGASMTEAGYGGGLPAGLDEDGDLLNVQREHILGTNPTDIDSDHDGIADGVEVFDAKTNPALPDTDADGLGDGCEDSNRDGVMDADETSPRVADTDRDDLCDGDGSAAGCPESKGIVCHQTETDRVCVTKPSTPVFGEDMNLNCQVDNGETDPRNPRTFGPADWDYKWSKFQSQTSSSSNSQ